MSLLIKALQKAEHGKNDQQLEKADIEDFLLELAPVGEPEYVPPDNKDAGQKPTAQSQLDKTTSDNQQAAAKLLAAKARGPVRVDSRISPLVLGFLLLGLMLAIGGGFLWYANSFLAQPEVIVPRPVALKPADVPIATPSRLEDEPTAIQTDIADDEVAASAGQPQKMESIDARAPLSSPPVKAAAKQPMAFGEPVADHVNNGVQISRNRPSTGINSTVMLAYQAFNRGDDAVAQQAYRQVLQGDARNIDALLGMAAIAARQGRNNDALGWYAKVQEIEPRNSIAQAARLELVSQADPLASESQLKSLIAQQPEAAYLHAALGNLYAEQAQWPLAQQAYFQAHHLDAANPEYAFNLAISLDQMGKSALALQYYRQTQALLAVRNSAAVDKAQLETRIQQLQ
ncbi:hypothetical protein LG200_09355 [Methylobacillus caricis]|uniref:hypothetical protein n=1 Tax=Methylobacillus caricis TaxID=1971611 RepID=UPI001CFF86E1|nr:hypothetical protein [Methylobacillus caricis]MCB5188203.1 hypothetical protein [Methylobacillus caricis]